MVLDILQKRRSIRKFKDEPVKQDDVDYLVEAMLRSPSSMGRNPWEFVVVSDQATLDKLSQAKPHGAAFVKNAPLAIVVCADPKKCDVWVEDTSVASMLLHLAGSERGLGSCWVQIRMRNHDENMTSSEYVAGLLSLPAGLEVEAIIAIGYPAEEIVGHPKESLLYERVHYGKFGGK